ncbi:MAG: glycosyltransferase [Pleomorphochaeta sp.]
MNILMIHYKVGGTDGVSLEMDKWKNIFNKMGHKVIMLGGEMDREIVYPPLYHISQIARDFYSYSFQNKPVFKNEEEYKDKLKHEVEKCEEIIEKFVDENNIDLVIAQNVWSVAMNIAVAIALENVIEKKHLKVLAQHHDFFWERKTGVIYGCDFAQYVSNKYLPPVNPTYKHVVINQQGHDTLLRRKNLESTIVPNVFDFRAPLWKKDSFNKDFKKDIGLSDDDIIILQATRIVDRKAIELAIDVISNMNKFKDSLINKTLYDGRTFNKNSNFVLLLAGYDGDDDSGTYLNRLKAKAKLKKVDLKVISSKVAHTREDSDEKIYSLWDTYVFADLISYPSYWEGWGNQFLEGLFAKKPMIVFEYPVFITDIKNKGFDYISLGSSYETDNNTDLVYIDDTITDKAAKESIEYLFDINKRQNSVEKNFEIGKEYFSMESLYKQLTDILNTID